MEKQFGFVAILDALGVSDYKIDECFNFISKKNELIKNLEKVDSEISTIFEKIIAPILEDQYKYPKMTVTTFGDSIIICWPTGTEKDSVVLFPGIALWLQRAVTLGIEYGILLRGSISVGDYLVDGDTTNTSILGPAIADAYVWSEEADWFGVILTPKCQIFMTIGFESPSDSDLWCVKYPVPLHHEKKELYTISWPFFFLQKNKSKQNGIVALTRLLSNFNIPKGVESKYENTIEFLEWYEKIKYPKLKEAQAKLKTRVMGPDHP
jgi:hypothetical protein